MPPGYTIRRTSSADVPTVARHRLLMFGEMGQQPVETAGPIDCQNRRHLAELVESGDYVGWFVEVDTLIVAPPSPFDAFVTPPGRVVAGAGVLCHTRLPNHYNPHGAPEAYVVNVYTERPHRRRGLASALMAEIVAWSRARGLGRVSLHASDEGRFVYERLGFVPTKEMALRLDEPSRPTPPLADAAR